MKHTPGPWHIGVRQAEQIVYDATGWAIANATVYHGEWDIEQVKANARLIAAAPDLLAALSGVIEWLELMGTHEENSRLVTARAAIKKAIGE